MKNIFIIFLIVMVVVSLAACSKDGSDQVPTNIENVSEQIPENETGKTAQETEPGFDLSKLAEDYLSSDNMFIEHPLVGSWYYEFSEGRYTQREEMEFKDDKTFEMKSILTDGENTEIETVSGLYEQAYNYVSIYFVSDGDVVGSTWMMVFMRQHEDHKNLYLMMDDGAFVLYRMDVPGEPEPMPKPEGMYWNSYCWEEDRELYMTLDFDACEVTMLYKNVDSSEPYKIVPFYVVDDWMYWFDGSYRLEGFVIGDTEYLFAENGPDHSTAWKELDRPVSSIEEAFPNASLAEILSLEPEYD